MSQLALTSRYILVFLVMLRLNLNYVKNIQEVFLEMGTVQ